MFDPLSFADHFARLADFSKRHPAQELPATTRFADEVQSEVAGQIALLVDDLTRIPAKYQPNAKPPKESSAQRQRPKAPGEVAGGRMPVADVPPHPVTWAAGGASVTVQRVKHGNSVRLQSGDVVIALATNDFPPRMSRELANTISRSWSHFVEMAETVRAAYAESHEQDGEIAKPPPDATARANTGNPSSVEAFLALYEHHGGAKFDLTNVEAVATELTEALNADGLVLGMPAFQHRYQLVSAFVQAAKPLSNDTLPDVWTNVETICESHEHIDNDWEIAAEKMQAERARSVSAFRRDDALSPWHVGGDVNAPSTQFPDPRSRPWADMYPVDYAADLVAYWSAAPGARPIELFDRAIEHLITHQDQTRPRSTLEIANDHLRQAEACLVSLRGRPGAQLRRAINSDTRLLADTVRDIGLDTVGQGSWDVTMPSNVLGDLANRNARLGNMDIAEYCAAQLIRLENAAMEGTVDISGSPLTYQIKQNFLTIRDRDPQAALRLRDASPSLREDDSDTEYLSGYKNETIHAFVRDLTY